jgi:hypothetical protein
MLEGVLNGPGWQEKLLVFQHHQALLRTYSLSWSVAAMKWPALDSVIQMVLKLEAEEDTFDGMLVEVSAEMRENPSNFVRFVKETQAISRPVLLLNGWGSHDVMRAAQQEGFSAAIQPGTTQELLSRLRGLRMAKSQVSRSADSGDFCLRSERLA